MIYPLPVFAEFEIDASSDIDAFIDNEKVMFWLSCGVDDIYCEMKAKRIIESFEVCNDGDVQNSVECDFEYLEVDCETEVLVDGLDYVQKIKLTEKQMLKLNEYLKDEKKMV